MASGVDGDMKILVTGGTGYFGKAFVKHLLDTDAAERICIYSRGEYAQHQMRVAMDNHPKLRWFIGDVRDRDRLQRAMSGCDTVVHAAALKRIEVVEYNVLEAVATNVLGTENVVKASIDAKVKKAVLLSTDKACDPCNAYGMSKALAERIFLSAKHYAGNNGPIFSVTRYGNVAGSTGSVIPMWREHLTKHDWVPVTDPDMTRFWMTKQEAVDLVFNTIQTMQGGELNIPELPAYRVGDLAEAMGAKMQITGTRGGEKWHEAMESGKTSDLARRMTVQELREALQHVD